MYTMQPEVIVSSSNAMNGEQATQRTSEARGQYVSSNLSPSVSARSTQP